MTLAQLQSQVLALPAQDRAALASQLLLSLGDEDPEADWEREWGEECARRIALADASGDPGIPGEVVMAKARALLR